MIPFALLPIVLLVDLYLCRIIDAHGYLKTPRSRNFVAYQEGVWSGGTEDTYPMENCPHCANRGGTVAQCGSIGQHNYDRPRNVFGQVMETAHPQMRYRQGQEIEVDVVITAHHKGHFEYYACPISRQGQVPTEACFQSNPLTFVSDPLYGATKDANYPQRAYIPPLSYSEIIYDTTLGIPGSLYRHRLKLPNALVGDLVLLQWHYLTANSCKYSGYDNYKFPDSWGNMHSGLGLCGPLPADGNGIPEQFWNCAEMAIQSGPVSPSTPVPLPAPSSNTVMREPSVYDMSELPPARVGQPCGGGVFGNGFCLDTSMCCSEWGWCGKSAQHCFRTMTQPSIAEVAGYLIAVLGILVGVIIAFVRCYRNQSCCGFSKR